MTEYVTLSDGKSHRVTDTGATDYKGHFVLTACGRHIRERQENVDVYMTEEAPPVEEYCEQCDHSGDIDLHPVFKQD